MNLLNAVHDLTTNPNATHIEFRGSRGPLQLVVIDGVVNFKFGERKFKPCRAYVEWVQRTDFEVKYKPVVPKPRRTARELTKDEIKYLVKTLLDELARR